LTLRLLPSQKKPLQKVHQRLRAPEDERDDPQRNNDPQNSIPVHKFPHFAVTKLAAKSAKKSSRLQPA